MKDYQLNQLQKLHDEYSLSDEPETVSMLTWLEEIFGSIICAPHNKSDEAEVKKCPICSGSFKNGTLHMRFFGEM